jgi:hypothetical protein
LPVTTADKLRQYGTAIAAYRHALARHLDDVSLRYERGVANAVGTAGGGMALRSWNLVPLDDPEVAAARRAVERLRQMLSTRADAVR